jgi:long-chain acyl-CoA synthetase
MLSPTLKSTITGELPPLVHGDRRLGPDELREQVERLAGGLAARGLGPGDPVALLLPNGPAFAIAFLAILRLGAVAVPLNPQSKQAELSFCFRDCGVRAVLSDERDIAGLMAERAPFATPAPRPLDEDAVYLYSSGSTGRPKRVPRTHRQLQAEADGYVATIGLTPEDTIFCAIPLFHTYGMGCCLLAAIRSGATLAILDAPQPFALARERVLQTLERERVTVFPAIPLMLRLLAEAPAHGADLSALRLCLSASNALPRSTFDAFDRAFGIPVRQLYGLTEAGAVTVNLDDDPWATAASVGRPIEGAEVAILDAPGRIGEIVIRGPGMMRGYAGVDERVNREAFRDGWFVTGDRGRLDDYGRLVITGRRKLLIDVRGDKVDPIEVEDVLAVHPKVREVVVVGVPSAVEGEQRVKAVVVADEPCGSRELIRFCRERLANHKVPQLVELRDEIPRSALGKVERKYLVERGGE